MESGRLNGQLILNKRKTTGDSVEMVAAILDVSPSTERQMEKGYLPRRGRADILNRLANYIGCSVAALFTPEAKRAG